MIMSDYKFSNNNGLDAFFIVDKLSNFTRCVPLMNENARTKTDDFSKNLTTSKRKPIKIESDRGTQFLNNFFENFLKLKKSSKFKNSLVKDLL